MYDVQYAAFNRLTESCQWGDGQIYSFDSYEDIENLGLPLLLSVPYRLTLTFCMCMDSVHGWWILCTTANRYGIVWCVCLYKIVRLGLCEYSGVWIKAIYVITFMMF